MSVFPKAFPAGPFLPLHSGVGLPGFEPAREWQAGHPGLWPHIHEMETARVATLKTCDEN